MTKIQFYVPIDAFGVLVNGLERQFGEATSVVDLDYASLRHSDYTLSYATDHGDNVLALLNVGSAWQIPEHLRAYRRD